MGKRKYPFQSCNRGGITFNYRIAGLLEVEAVNDDGSAVENALLF